MKPLTFYSLLLLVLSSSELIGEEAKKVVPTKNKFAKQLSESVQSQLTFAKQKESIQIQAKPKATLPLEFIAGKGLEPSDGILSMGDSFAWPGCGFDRTSYAIKEIAPNYIVIGYTRGIPQQDGYQDAGEFKVSYGNQEEAEQVGAGQPATAPQLKSEGSDKPQPEAEGRSQ